MSECSMVLVEDDNLDLWWECSECSSNYSATDAFERNKSCPCCGANITEWWSIYDE